MKRCQNLSAIIYVLVLASLVSFTSCGIPYFLNLDNTISWSKSYPDPTKLDIGLTVSSHGMEKVDEVKTTPSIKFFYVFSTNSTISSSATKTNDINDTYYRLSSISTQFSHIKGNLGNGFAWSPESSDIAPGFYLYSTEDPTTHRNFARERSAITDRSGQESGIIVETFSQGFLLSNNKTDYDFGASPYMDAMLPVNSWGGSGSPLSYSFTLERVSSAPNTPYGIKFTDGSQTIYFADYAKNLFPHTSEEADLSNFINPEDSYFHQPVYTEIKDNPEANLYLHIWATVFGGDGTFTNIYWSNLEYLGNIQLF